MDKDLFGTVSDILYKNGCQIEFLDRETEKIMAVINQNADKIAEMLAEEKCTEKTEKLKLEITADVRQEFLIEKGIEITGMSPFISETVIVDGLVLSREDFIPNNFKHDPDYDEKQLWLNPYNRHWQIQTKTKGPQFVSSVEVIGCLIVEASGPGICFAYAVFIKGRGSPLIFFDGELSDRNIINELQLEEKSLKNKYVSEAFRRSLSMCNNVFFYSLPHHAGWNVTPDGRLTFVSAVMDIPLFSGLFGDRKGQHRNVARDIILKPTKRTLESITTDYQKLLLKALPLKIGTVISTMARLLPQYKEEGIIRWIIWLPGS